MSTIVELRSGGQTGADRGAMEAAEACGVRVSGWCPAGGWAEDLPDPPGIRALFPQMVETPSGDVLQRTEWNIRDSTCCIALVTRERNASPGTEAGFAFYRKYSKSHFEIEIGGTLPLDEQIARARAWLETLDDDAIVLGFAGPRESEFAGAHDIAYAVATALLAP